MKTVEESNDASRIRLLRMRRGIEKMRLERAFLLEQLAKRTSTNVEDSDGSPSPPPTVGNPTSPPTSHTMAKETRLKTGKQPKEKPLRTKRGRRAPDYLQGLPDTAAGLSHGDESRQPSFNDSVNGNSNSAPMNPSRAGPSTSRTPQANGTQPPRNPCNGFDVFVNSMRSVLLVANRRKIKEGTYDVDQDLARKWRDLGEGQNVYYRRFEDGEFDGWEDLERRDIRRLAEGDESEGEADAGEDAEMGEESGEGERH